MAILMVSFPVMYKECMYAFDSGAVLVGTVFSYHVLFTDIAGIKFRAVVTGNYNCEAKLLKKRIEISYKVEYVNV